MSPLKNPPHSALQPASEMLSLRNEPLFLADWDRVVMIHYELDAGELQKVVPFELDYWHGQALASIVAFNIRRMRPRVGGRLTEWLLKPISTHEFFNVRTYVRHKGEIGIFFLAEWLSNRLSVALGPPFFGLPYRFGRIRYDHPTDSGQFAGTVNDISHSKFTYVASSDLPLSLTPNFSLAHEDFRSWASRPAAQTETVSNSFPPPFEPCEISSFSEWLMERYTAFTSVHQTRRFFRVWHNPWPQIPIQPKVTDQSLLEANWPFFRNATVIGGNFSPGVKDVWMGWPRRFV